MSYPVVFGLPNARIINSLLKRIAYSQISQYSKENDGIEPVTVNGFIKGDYTIKLAVPRALSIRFDFETYSPDAVHSLDLVRSFNYSPARNREIKLQDLFARNIDYCEVLSVLLVSEFLERTDQVDLTPLLTEQRLTKRDFGTFLLNRNGFEFVFNEYQIAPYAAGTINLVVPCCRVSGLLCTNSPIATFALKPKQHPDEAWVLTRKDLERRLAIVAVGAYSRAITNGADNGQAYYGRGVWYKKLGRQMAAEKDFEEAEALMYPRLEN